MLPQPLVISRTGAARLLDSELGAGFALIAVDAEVELFDRLDDLLWKELNAVRLILVTDDRVPRSADDIRTVADTTGQLSRFFDGAKGHFVLVRPDRYVAAVFGPDEEAEVTAVLRSRLW